MYCFGLVDANRDNSQGLMSTAQMRSHQESQLKKEEEEEESQYAVDCGSHNEHTQTQPWLCVCVCLWFQVSTRLLTSQRWHIPSGILTLSASAWSPSSEGASPTHPHPHPRSAERATWPHYLSMSVLSRVLAQSQSSLVARKSGGRKWGSVHFRYDRTSAFKREWTRHRKGRR